MSSGLYCALKHAKDREFQAQSLGKKMWDLSDRPDAEELEFIFGFKFELEFKYEIAFNFTVFFEIEVPAGGRSEIVEAFFS